MGEHFKDLFKRSSHLWPVEEETEGDMIYYRRLEEALIREGSSIEQEIRRTRLADERVKEE